MQNKSILKQIYKFYPAEISNLDTKYENTNENGNLKSVLDAPPFTENRVQILRKFESSFGKEMVSDMTMLNWGNPCYHFRIKGEKETIHILFISLIGDFFYLYSNDDLWNKIEQRDKITYAKICEYVSNCFPDHEMIRPDVAKTIIHDISYGNKDFGEVTILNCLFTDHIYY